MSKTHSHSTKSFRKSRWGVALTLIAVVGTSVLLRHLVSTNEANAQERSPRTKSVRSSSSAKATDRKSTTRKTTARSSRTKVVNPIAAVVNDQKITREYLAKQCIRRFGEEVLESLVNKHLILQECQRAGIKITRKDIDNEIDSIASKFNISADLWLNMLRDEKGIEAEQYKLDVIWPTLALQRLAADQLKVTKQELAKEYESEYGAKVQVRMISVKSKAKAAQLLAQVKADPDSFPEVAKDHSEDTNSAAARGLIPPIRKHLGFPEIEKIAFGLKPGEISPAIEVANQFIILRCEDHIEPATISAQFKKNVEQQLTDRIRDRKLRTVSAEKFKSLQDAAEVQNVYNDEKLSKQMPTIAAMINGKRITLAKLGEECLSRYGTDVLDSEINYRLLKQELNRLGMQVGESDLDDEIARAAESFGFFQKDGATPDVEKWMKDVTEREGVPEDIYLRDAVWPTAALKKIVGAEVKITEEDLKKGFEANYGQRVKVLAIVLSNQRQAHTVWEMARKDPSAENFGKLAEQFSIEPVSRANFGEVPPIHKHGGQPLVEKEAFSLKEGALSGILSVGDKFIILKCMGRTDRVVESIDDVKDELTSHIREQKMRVAMSERFEAMKAKAKIQNFLLPPSKILPGPKSADVTATKSAVRPVVTTAGARKARKTTRR